MKYIYREYEVEQIKKDTGDFIYICKDRICKSISELDGYIDILEKKNVRDTTD